MIDSRLLILSHKPYPGRQRCFKMFLCNLKLQIPLSKFLLFSDNSEVFQNLQMDEK